MVDILKKIFNTDDIELCAGKIDGTKATEIIRAYIVSFFDKYLKNQQAPLLDDQDKKYAEDVEFECWIK